jgi:hypothetical protein
MADETYALDLRPEAVIPWHRPYDRFVLPLGDGYLAGELPDGLTTVEGAPVAATVRVLLRESGPGDGALLAEVQSAADGTWRVTGLPAGRLYDVVGRLAGRNDVIVSGVSPATE